MEENTDSTIVWLDTGWLQEIEDKIVNNSKERRAVPEQDFKVKRLEYYSNIKGGGEYKFDDFVETCCVEIPFIEQRDENYGYEVVFTSPYSDDYYFLRRKFTMDELRTMDIIPANGYWMHSSHTGAPENEYWHDKPHDNLREASDGLIDTLITGGEQYRKEQQQILKDIEYSKKVKEKTDGTFRL